MLFGIPVRMIVAGLGGWVVGNAVVDTVRPGPLQSIPQHMTQPVGGSGVTPFFIFAGAILLFALAYAAKTILGSFREGK